jgi:hypothetical protein
MNDTPAKTTAPADRPFVLPDYQPEERFWPYVELTEQPTPEELAALDPDLRAALYGAADIPFSFTLVFPRFDGPDFERALELARASAEYREVGSGDQFRIRARFYAADVARMRDLFAVIPVARCWSTTGPCRSLGNCGCRLPGFCFPAEAAAVIRGVRTCPSRVPSNATCRPWLRS